MDVSKKKRTYGLGLRKWIELNINLCVYICKLEQYEVFTPTQAKL